ncbi:MAG: (d)CMP kinase [Clostridia bacterium]|nr:(d)CMP kinase [Clostridia bacterium]
MSKYVNIAIDGPSGAGKSTIAKAVAKKKSYIYLDTGAMYRSYALYMIKKGIDVKSLGENELRLKAKDAVADFNLEIIYNDAEQHVVVNGEDYTDLIRTPEISTAASKVAQVPAIREYLVDLQRKIAASNNVVMDGRDIGSNVLKDASVKIFLTASAEVRAKRRFDELKVKDSTVDYEKILENMKARDLEDTTREVSPLVCAEDAVVVDSTDMSLDEAIETILKIAEERN